MVFTGQKEVRDAVISARVTSAEKEELKKRGCNLHDAVKFYLVKTSTNKQKLKYKKFFLQEDIKALNKEINDKKMDLISMEMELEEINKELGITEINNVEYGDEVMECVDTAIQRMGSTSHDVRMYAKCNKSLISHLVKQADISEDEFLDLVEARLK